MPTYYVDLYNGVDHPHANSGLSWTTAYKTISGLTSKVTTITGGDTIRVSKTNDPVNTGINATWTGVYSVGGGLEAAKNIVATTGSTPINVQVNTHGYSNGDVVHLQAHTVNLSANGYWIITGVTTSQFQLVGSIGMANGAAAGTVTKINPKVILLDTPLTKNIHTCDYISATINNWTPGTNVTSANLSTTIWKEGYSSLAIVTAAGVGSGQTLAKSALPVSLDLSAYSGISFWGRFSTAILAGQLQIKLYSDTGCTNEVESFDIPAFTAANVYQSFNINKGSALSSTVQGIAVYANVTLASKTYYFDNFIAIKDPSDVGYLYNGSIVSKNGAMQVNSGNTEGFYPIKCINEKIVVIDNHNECYANAGRGYWGTTENVPLYTRQPIRCDNNSSYCYRVGVSLANMLNVEYGHNTGTTTIDGETWYDAGYVVNPLYMQYVNCDGFIGVTRKGQPIAMVSNRYNNISCIGSASFAYFSSYYIFFNNIWNWTNNVGQFGNGTSQYNVAHIFINNLWNVKNSLGFGVLWITSWVAQQSQINFIDNITNNTTGIEIAGNINDSLYINNVDRNTLGIQLNSSFKNVYILKGLTNNTNGITSLGGLSTLNGRYNSIISGNTYVRKYDCIDVGRYTINNTLIFKNFNSYQNYSFINTLGAGPNTAKTIYNDIIYRDSDMITQDTGTTYSGNNSWKFNIKNSFSNGNYIFGLTYENTVPLTLTIGKVYVAAGLPVTVSAYMKNSHATAIGAKLYMAPYQLSGQTTELKAYSTSTVWTKITLPTFTPAEAGVIEIQAHAWYISSTTDSVWVDNLEVIQ